MTSQQKVNGSTDFHIRRHNWCHDGFGRNQGTLSLMVEHHCDHGSNKKKHVGSFWGYTVGILLYPISDTFEYVVHVVHMITISRPKLHSCRFLRSLRLSTESSTSTKSFTTLGSLGKERVAGRKPFYDDIFFSRACPGRLSKGGPH